MKTTIKKMCQQLSRAAVALFPTAAMANDMGGDTLSQVLGGLINLLQSTHFKTRTF